VIRSRVGAWVARTGARFGGRWKPSRPRSESNTVVNDVVTGSGPPAGHRRQCRRGSGQAGLPTQRPTCVALAVLVDERPATPATAGMTGGRTPRPVDSTGARRGWRGTSRGALSRFRPALRRARRMRASWERRCASVLNVRSRINTCAFQRRSCHAADLRRCSSLAPPRGRGQSQSGQVNPPRRGWVARALGRCRARGYRTPRRWMRDAPAPIPKGTKAPS
jgi:hypothetical protein